MSPSSLVASLAILLCVLAARSLAAEPPAVDPAAARAALAEGHPREARDALKALVAADPLAREAHLLLAAAYLADENVAWAVRVLDGWLAGHPADCEARTLLAWAHVTLGTADAAAPALEGACPEPGPLQARADLLRALVAHAADQPEARRGTYRQARGAAVAFPADRDALRALRPVLDPERPDDLSWSIDLSGGVTTNARLGAPTDPSKGADAASGLALTTLFVRGTPDVGWGLVRPAGEAQVRALRFFSAGAREQSYLNLTGRVGVLLDWGRPRVTLGYRPDVLAVAGGDSFDSGPLWYAAGHRGEVEVEIAPWMLVLAGGGARTFRELGRSRAEADLGLAGQAPLASRFRLAWAALGRVYRARDPVYHQWGASGLLSGTTRVWRDMTVRTGVLAAFDAYPNSGTYFGTVARRDLFVRGSLGTWSPSLRGVRLGLTYEFSHRATTADAWSFSDHRVTFALRWSGSWSGGLPAAAAEHPTVDVPWGLDPDQPDERVSDLLRLDEPVQSVCGCAQ